MEFYFKVIWILIFKESLKSFFFQHLAVICKGFSSIFVCQLCIEKNLYYNLNIVYFELLRPKWIILCLFITKLIMVKRRDNSWYLSLFLLLLSMLLLSRLQLHIFINSSAFQSLLWAQFQYWLIIFFFFFYKYLFKSRSGSDGQISARYKFITLDTAIDFVLVYFADI